MTHEPTADEAPGAAETPGTDREVAWLVAALGGGPGDRRDLVGPHPTPERRPPRDDRPRGGG